jgi:hypothetical protein
LGEKLLRDEAENPDPARKYVGNINQHRLDLENPDPIRAIINEVATSFNDPEIQESRRGTQSNEATKKKAMEMLAQETGQTMQSLLDRKFGEAWNAEQITAARGILVASADRIALMAKAIRSGDANSDANLVAFRKALEYHAAIQEQVHGIAAEAGRALQAFKIMMGGDTLGKLDTAQMLESMGGRNGITKMAEVLADVVETGELENINKAVDKKEVVFDRNAPKVARIQQLANRLDS